MDGSGPGSYRLTGYGISGIELSGCATRTLITVISSCRDYMRPNETGCW
jgi:hypothetical protein